MVIDCYKFKRLEETIVGFAGVELLLGMNRKKKKAPRSKQMTPSGVLVTVARSRTIGLPLPVHGLPS